MSDLRSPHYRPPDVDRDEQKLMASRFHSDNMQADSLAYKFFADLMPERKPGDPTFLLASERITWQGRYMSLLEALDTLIVPAYMMRLSVDYREFNLEKAMQDSAYVELRGIIEPIIAARKVRWEAEKTLRATQEEDTSHRWWHDK
jgi:hypothetical protein